MSTVEVHKQITADEIAHTFEDEVPKGADLCLPRPMESFGKETTPVLRGQPDGFLRQLDGQLGRRARAHVEQRYRWPVAAQTLECIYQGLLEARH